MSAEINSNVLTVNGYNPFEENGSMGLSLQVNSTEMKVRVDFATARKLHNVLREYINLQLTNGQWRYGDPDPQQRAEAELKRLDQLSSTTRNQLIETAIGILRSAQTPESSVPL